MRGNTCVHLKTSPKISINYGCCRSLLTKIKNKFYVPFHDFTWQFSPAFPISCELTTGLEIFDNHHQLSGRYNCFPSPCAVAKFSSFTLKKKPKVQLCPNSISPLMYSATSPGISWAGPRCSAVASVAGSWDSDLRLVSYRRGGKNPKRNTREIATLELFMFPLSATPALV